VPDLPVGAKCWATETDTGGATESTVDHGGPAAPLVLGDRPGTIVVTNEFDAADLTVTKRVVNGPAGPYSFELSCTTGEGPVELRPQDAAFELRDGKQRTISVPLGATCTIEEVDVADAAVVTFREGRPADGRADGKVVVGRDRDVTVVNTFTGEVDSDLNSDDDDGDVGGTQAGPDDSPGVLPNLGGPTTGLLALAALLLAVGAGLVWRGRRTARDNASSSRFPQDRYEPLGGDRVGR
jgi:hypothetical protein